MTELYLRSNQITDVSALEGLTALTTLRLFNNFISDYTPLRRLRTAIAAIEGHPGLDLEITIPADPNNNAPVLSDGASTTRSIVENIAAGTDIGSAIAATDADTGDTLTYTLSGTDASSFTIVSTSGQLKTRAVLDYETKRSYSVTVTVSDGKGGSDTISVTINVTDVVNEPTPVKQRTQQVQAAIVAAINGVDSADDVTTAQLAGITTLNLVRKGITSLKSGDFDGLTGLTTLEMAYNDRLSALPAGVFDDLTALTTLNLSYNALSALPAGIFDELTVLTTLNLAYNSISNISELEDLTSLTKLYLAVNPISDYDPLRKLIAAIEAAGGTLTHDFKIFNRNPAFTDGDSTTRTVAENTASGTNIGTAVAATDADNDTLTYTLGGTDANSFTIEGTSGQLKTSAALDYETKSSYSVTVSVSDGNGGSDSIDVTINVTDVNDIPTFTDGTDTTRSIPENTASGTNIGTPVAATDGDKDTLTYTLGGTDASSFTIVSTNGQLKTSAALDYERKSSYSLTVSVSDGNGGSDLALRSPSMSQRSR